SQEALLILGSLLRSPPDGICILLGVSLVNLGNFVQVLRRQIFDLSPMFLRKLSLLLRVTRCSLLGSVLGTLKEIQAPILHNIPQKAFGGLTMNLATASAACRNAVRVLLIRDLRRAMKMT